ncbi:hypothetical protein SASPL_103782 [Salvia splendens]|uniref:Dienelactone hydrolase domain-containing protein n=1 Tax=Salvia splendens TaxID=180675 RepID=A0A8X9A8G5_SALSN|nr:hypothetical protein SASPL_103782 [Salvia splendens]
MKRLAEVEISTIAKRFNLRIKEIIAEDEGEAANVCVARGRELMSPHSRCEELVGMGCHREDVEKPATKRRCSGSGKVEEFGGLSSYISGPADSNSAVILISDVYGYEVEVLSLIRRLQTKSGLLDLIFHRDPTVPDPNTFTEWLKTHGPDQGFEDAKPVIEALKSKGMTKIGGVGFCWGGWWLWSCRSILTSLSILGAEIDLVYLHQRLSSNSKLP